MKVVFDMDTGVDDSLALIYALNRPAYEIQGIGCVYGNVESWLAAENTMKILDLVNAPDIPVVIGANEPLTGKWAGRVSIIHGENGLGNVELPKSERKPFDKGIEEFYLETAERLQGEMVLITVGPLTNIARTIKKYDILVCEEFSCLEFHTDRDTINWILKIEYRRSSHGKTTQKNHGERHRLCSRR